MDCYNWRNCEADCDHCEVANMDIAQAVQAWDDPEYLIKHWSPEEVLGLLQQLGKQAEQAEQGRQTLESKAREMGEELQGLRQQVQDLMTRGMRCEEFLNSISCLVAEGPEFMRSGDIYHKVGQEAGQAMRILRGEE